MALIMRVFIALVCCFVTVNAMAIPAKAYQYQRQIIRAVWTYHGSDKLVSTMAAQIHQESYWDESARSWVGASGLTQFMPATAKGESKRCGLGIASPLNPSWAIQAQNCYMAYLIKRNYEFKHGCERTAAGLSGYNGGQGNVNKQRRKWARETRSNANSNVSWFDGVEHYRVRGKSTHEENQGYPQRILFDLTPRYVAANYGGIDLCKV